jgi:hypothetical protein
MVETNWKCTHRDTHVAFVSKTFGKLVSSITQWQSLSPLTQLPRWSRLRRGLVAFVCSHESARLICHFLRGAAHGGASRVTDDTTRTRFALSRSLSPCGCDAQIRPEHTHVSVFIRLKGVIVFRELHRKHFHADRTRQICFMRVGHFIRSGKSILTPSCVQRKVKRVGSAIIKLRGIFTQGCEKEHNGNQRC